MGPDKPFGILIKVQGRASNGQKCQKSRPRLYPLTAMDRPHST
jgi:hypothetical protein